MDNNHEELEKQAKIIEEEIEIAVTREEIKQEEIQVEGRVFYYTKTILSGVLDQMLVVGLALVAFVVFGFLLKLIGYQIVMRDEMFLIMYIITNVLYYPLTQEFLDGKTLGKKIMTR